VWVRSRAACVLAAALCFVTSLPAQEETTGRTEGFARLKGKVTSDNKPLEGAVVIAYELSTEQVHRSTPTDGKGRYEISELPLGYYDLAVQTTSGLFVGNQVVNIPPSDKTEVDFAVAPYSSAAAAAEVREFPGSDQAAQGVATVGEGQTAKEFWKSPKGIAILVGGGGVVLLAIAASGGDDDPVAVEPPATPFMPSP
jgi:hypothetical protein